MWGSVQVLPNQVREKSFYTFEDVDLRECHAKLHKKLGETQEADSIYSAKISDLHRVCLQK